MSGKGNALLQWVAFALLLPIAGQSFSQNFVGVSAGYGHVIQEDVDSSNGLLIGGFARHDFAFGRSYKVVTSTDLLFGSMGATEETAAETLIRTSADTTFNLRWPATRSLTVWGGAGFGLGYSWHRNRYTLDAGYLGKEYENQSGFEYGLILRTELAYTRSRDFTISISPQYHHSIGTGVNAVLVQIGMNL